ncbi:uncharacterized protein LOC131604204 [Vicia villosa]|uniref:uncharacterized protein LOC131604204 n=1 Tax=Vicia villosa TaxID=3911 RepID=UPI00273C7C20|nr:uncharacterized protein LOC131604204 [Vicia villosa]
MAQILTFFYVWIIFLSVLIIVTDGGKRGFEPIGSFIPCRSYKDCPEDMCLPPRIRHCILGYCECR